MTVEILFYHSINGGVLKTNRYNW